MSILAGFMVPHPPLIVPAVGRGSEEEVRETIDAYDRVADEIAALKPETIIITSPHATMYSNYFHISPGQGAKGSFADFGAPQVKFDETYDSGLWDLIASLAEAEDFPAGIQSRRTQCVDYEAAPETCLQSIANQVEMQMMIPDPKDHYRRKLDDEHRFLKEKYEELEAELI